MDVLLLCCKVYKESRGIGGGCYKDKLDKQHNRKWRSQLSVLVL
jgi:hypothetical protein